MFTVVLLSDYSRRRLERWRDLFAHFEQSGDMAFCTWYRSPSATSLEQAAPSLERLVWGKAEWRLVIVGNGTEGFGSADEGHLNPFDFDLNDAETSGNSGHVSSSAEEEYASTPSLLRMLYMVMGYPQLGVVDFKPDPSFVLSADRRDELEDPASQFDPLSQALLQLSGRADRAGRIYLSALCELLQHQGISDEEAERLFEIERLEGNDAQVHYRETPVSDALREQHAQLAALYRSPHTRPTSVLMVASRPAVAEDPTAALRIAWNESARGQASRFVDRNSYPDSCRFVVYDENSDGRSARDIDELRFWLSVLTLAVNELPPSGLQAERLYRVSVDLDQSILADTINDHLRRMMSLTDHLTARARKPVTPRSRELHDLLEKAPVLVPDADLSHQQLSVSTSGYGLAADRPRGTVLWSESFQRLSEAAEAFSRKPRRIAAQLATDARRQMHQGPQITGALTPTERLELEDDLLERTSSLTQPASRDFLDRKQLLTLLDRSNSRIRRALAQRLNASSIMIVLTVTLLAWLFSFTPYIIQAGLIGGVEFSESLLVAAVCIGTMAIVSLLVLVFKRRRFRKLLQKLNAELRLYVSRVSAGAEDYASFLGRLIEYMWRRDVLITEDQRDRDYEVERRTLDGFQRRVKQRIEEERSLVRSLDRGVMFESGERSHHEFYAESVIQMEREFRWPRGSRQCFFNHSGERISAPYDFIERLTLDDIHVREPEQKTPDDSNGPTQS